MAPSTRSAAPRAGPPRAPRAARRARARDHQLLVVLALDDVLGDRRADDLPARVRLRLRLARLDGRRLRLRRVRRHRHGRDGGAVLVGLPGDVRDVHQVQVPAHVRRDPRRAGRHRGARHRRGAVDRGARRRLRLRADARRDASSGSTRAGACCSCRSSASSPASAGRASGSSRRAMATSIENFNYIISAVLTPLFLVAGTFFPLDAAARVGADAGAAQPALPPRRARARTRRSASTAGPTSATSPCSSPSASLMWRLAIWRLEKRLID